MKRVLFYFIFFSVLILLLTTCGIANVYVPTYGTSSSSDIAVTRNSDTGAFTVTLSQTIINELSTNKPTLHFFYTISSSSQSSAYSSLISAFNNTFTQETSGNFINSDNPIFTNEYGSNDSKREYGLYQLTNSSGEAFSYDMGHDDLKNSFTITLDTSTNKITLTDEGNDSIITQYLGRYNNLTFTRSSGTNDITDYLSSEIYTVNVYLLISCRFDSYSNTYNTKIERSYPVLSFTLSD